MAWTVVDDDGVIQIRASIDPKTQQDQLRDLIVALEKRLLLPRQIEELNNV